jgi:hypothetical protein
MGRKGGPSRLDKRRENEAYEKRQEDEEVEEVEEEEGEEEEDEEAEADAEVEADAEIDAEADADADVGDEGDEDDEDRPKKKAKKVVKKPAAKKAPTKRSRAAKEVRTRAVWVVYDNGNKVVEKFPYNQRAEAEALLAKKLEEKKGTFYINMVKEEIKE